MSFFAAPLLGNIQNPLNALAPGSNYGGNSGQGLIVIISNLVKLLIVVAGIYAFLNILLAGYGFLSAGGEPKNIAKAWEKIWQSLVGLIIVAGSFILAVIFGYIIFGPDNAMILINPRLYTPTP